MHVVKVLDYVMMKHRKGILVRKINDDKCEDLIRE